MGAWCLLAVASRATRSKIHKNSAQSLNFKRNLKAKTKFQICSTRLPTSGVPKSKILTAHCVFVSVFVSCYASCNCKQKHFVFAVGISCRHFQGYRLEFNAFCSSSPAVRRGFVGRVNCEFFLQIFLEFKHFFANLSKKILSKFKPNSHFFATMCLFK